MEEAAKVFADYIIANSNRNAYQKMALARIEEAVKLVQASNALISDDTHAE